MLFTESRDIDAALTAYSTGQMSRSELEDITGL